MVLRATGSLAVAFLSWYSLASIYGWLVVHYGARLTASFTSHSYELVSATADISEVQTPTVLSINAIHWNFVVLATLMLMTSWPILKERRGRFAVALLGLFVCHVAVFSLEACLHIDSLVARKDGTYTSEMHWRGDFISFSIRSFVTPVVPCIAYLLARGGDVLRLRGARA